MDGMRNKIATIMMLALVNFHLGEEVQSDWFAEYGMARDMGDDGTPLEVATEKTGGY